jgi:outer membrane cobalamin receptor
MKYRYTLLFLTLILLSCTSLFAQNATIKGIITNATTRETIPGVNVITDEKTGVASDIDGKYVLKIHPGKSRLVYKFMGFANVTKLVDVKAGETLVIDIQMTERSQALEGVVVSAGKFEQKLADVTISMDVIKADQIANQNANNIMESLNKINGVDIYDSQPSIRGGSGYSYGAGSRVLLLVDDLPMLTPDAGDVKWNYLPIENIAQVEVLKGASSALFGSSALNGVINLRTAYPKDKPETRISINNGVYMNPKRKELIWWNNENLKYSKGSAAPFFFPFADFGVKNPGFGGLNFFHSRKIGQLDLVIGGNVYMNQSFREMESEARGRLNANLRYRVKKIEGLSFGINANYMYQDKTNFFLWQNADSGAYRQNPSTVNYNKGYRFNVDPYLMYFNKRASKYSFKMRFYRQTNHFKEDPTKNNDANVLYGDYQYQHKFKERYNFTAGLSGNYTESTALLFGHHYGTNASIYAQVDASVWKRVTFSLGLRGEYFKIDKSETVSTFSIRTKKDTLKIPIEPVFRAGVNFHAAKYTFIRASFGQGYRFPTIAEKYIYTSIGGLHIFPNPGLQPETGWSAELGIKQGFKVGTWTGFIDLAGFWTQYKNMMEFTFGIYKPDTALYPTLNDIGFKSINVGHAKINGIDFALEGKGTIFGFPATFLAGYTYMNPVNLDYDAAVDTAIGNKYLKYRFFHSVKADFEITFSLVTIGLSYTYNSYIINIDKAFESELIPGVPSSDLLPGLKQYRLDHNKGYHIVNGRLWLDITEKQRIGLFVNNILNEEYMTRPGFIEAPRNIAINYSLKF